MKRIFYFTLIALLAISFSMQAKKKLPVISFAESSYNFGTIPEKGGKVSHTFEFTNTGDANLVIIDAKADCGCTVPEYSAKPIAPGEKGEIKVTYNPLYRPGGFTKTITVQTNAKPKKARLVIKGSVTPAK